MLIPLLIVVVLVAVNAFYVAAEFGAVSVRHSRIKQLEEEGNWFALRLAPVLQNPSMVDRYVAASQIGITWSSLLLGAYTQASLTPQITTLLQHWTGTEELVAISAAAVIVLIVTTTFQVIFGELVPKSIALQYPDQTALYTTLPMIWSMRVYHPFLTLLNGSGLRILRWLGFEATGHRHIHSPEELELLIAESRKGGMLDADEHKRLRRAIRLASRPVRQLMVPRSQVTALNVDASEKELLDVIRTHRYTRYPVYRGSPDQIVGLLHTADLVIFYVRNRRLPAVGEIMRPLIRVLENDSGDRLLGRFRESRTYQAAVLNEFGVAGLVTVGDLLAELLDDTERSAALGQPEPEVLPDGRVRLPGLLRVDEAVAWLGVPLGSATDTLGGALLQAFGRVPKPGESIQLEGVDVTIERLNRNTIASVLAYPVHSDAEPAEE